MKFSAKQYATALYELLEIAESEQISEIINEFARIIFENGDAGKIEEIAENFEEVWNEKTGVVEAEVISVHELNEGMIDILKDYIATVTDASEVKLHQKVDKETLGGVVIKYRDKVLDASLKKELRDLKKQMKK